jgi:hypothetical protein
MLLADPSDLAPGASGPLGEHLARCEACAAAARAILARDAEMDAALSALVGRYAPDAFAGGDPPPSLGSQAASPTLASRDGPPSLASQSAPPAATFAGSPAPTHPTPRPTLDGPRSDRALATWTRQTRRSRRALAALVPLAAAAVLALLHLRSPALQEPTLATGIDTHSHAVVNAVGGRGVAVMQTRNPNITVVWHF